MSDITIPQMIFFLLLFLGLLSIQGAREVVRWSFKQEVWWLCAAFFFMFASVFSVSLKNTEIAMFIFTFSLFLLSVRNVRQIRKKAFSYALNGMNRPE